MKIDNFLIIINIFKCVNLRILSLHVILDFILLIKEASSLRCIS